MLQTGYLKSIIWHGIKYTDRILTLVIGVSAFLISNLDANKSPPPFLKELLFFVQGFLRENAWWIIVYSLIAKFIIWLIQKYGLSDPKLNEAITTALDNARTFLIKDSYLYTEQEYHHRVTLFKYTTFCYWPRPQRSILWPWGRCEGGIIRHPFSGWLVPVARSGHTTKKVRSVFLVPDDAQHSQGIAGKAWSQSGAIFKDGLSFIHPSSNQDNVNKYSRSCFISSNWTKARINNSKPLARSYLGFKISIDQKAWGVIVVDSVQPDGVNNPQSLQQQLNQLELLIASLVKREVV